MSGGLLYSQPTYYSLPEIGTIEMPPKTRLKVETIQKSVTEAM